MRTFFSQVTSSRTCKYSTGNNCATNLRELASVSASKEPACRGNTTQPLSGDIYHSGNMSPYVTFEDEETTQVQFSFRCVGSPESSLHSLTLTTGRMLTKQFTDVLEVSELNDHKQVFSYVNKLVNYYTIYLWT